MGLYIVIVEQEWCVLTHPDMLQASWTPAFTPLALRVRAECGHFGAWQGMNLRGVICLASVTSSISLSVIGTLARVTTMLHMADEELRGGQQQSAAMLRWLSHECRSPVAVSLLVMDSIRSELQRRLEKDLAAAEQPLNMLSGILDNMLVYLHRMASAAAGKHHQLPIARELDLGVAIGDFLDITPQLIMSYDVEEPHITGGVTVKLPDGKLHSVKDDAPLQSLASTGLRMFSPVSASTVRQVLMNLFTNALKYGTTSVREGGHPVTLEGSASIDISVKLA
ncbi:unnamed protein product, partial [Symbiodinium sp. KB8]